MWPKWKVVLKTKHSKTKTEVRSTQNSKTQHLNLENEAPIENEALENEAPNPNQVETADAFAPTKVDKTHPKVLWKPANCLTERC